TIKEQEPRRLNEESADRTWKRPNRKLKRRQLDPVRLQRALNQQDRGNGDENVLAEEQADIVGRRRHRGHMLSGRLVELPMLLLGGGKRHRRDQRPDRLSLARHRSQAERRKDLAETEIEDEHPPRRGAAHPADQSAGL